MSRALRDSQCTMRNPFFFAVERKAIALAVLSYLSPVYAPNYKHPLRPLRSIIFLCVGLYINNNTRKTGGLNGVSTKCKEKKKQAKARAGSVASSSRRTMRPLFLVNKSKAMMTTKERERTDASYLMDTNAAKLLSELLLSLSLLCVQQWLLPLGEELSVRFLMSGCLSISYPRALVMYFLCESCAFFLCLSVYDPLSRSPFSRRSRPRERELPFGHVAAIAQSVNQY